MLSGNNEVRVMAQDVAAAVEPQPPAFANNDRFHNITVKAKISDRFEIYDPHSVEQTLAIRDMGFRQVILDWPNLHREATQLGLDVVIANWWTIDTEVSEIEKRMEFVREIDPERFAAISMMDEPERNSPDTPFSYIRPCMAISRRPCSRIIQTCHWKCRIGARLLPGATPEYEKFIPLYQSADLIRIMPYPDLREGPLSEVYYQMLRSRHVMKLAGREIPQLVTCSIGNYRKIQSCRQSVNFV